jgi:hypothetical protein
MNKPFESIESLALDKVTGGGNSTSQAQIGVQAKIPRVGPVNVGVNASRSTTDYKTCADTVRSFPNSKPSDLAAACGLPPSN